jgi:hypothetical protein
VQTVILIGFSIATMIIYAVDLPYLYPASDYVNASQDVNKEIAYGLLVIVSSIFFIYFAFDAVCFLYSCFPLWIEVLTCASGHE